MQCNEFNVRLNKLLDLRRAPQRDPRLRRHAQVCPDCAAQLSAMTRLLDGLDLGGIPPLADDFAARVVHQVAPGPSRRLGWHPLALAVAATLLLTLIPGLGYLLRASRAPGNAAPTPPGRSGEIAYMTPVPNTLRSTAAENSAWARYGNSILELYPEATRQRHRRRVSEFAEDLRPIASPFNAAVTAIRRTIPVNRPATAPQPSASVAPDPLGPFTHA